MTNPNTSVLPRALTIAGSDSGGGAGIQADLKTFSALQCYGTSAIIALTAQNTLGVHAIHTAPPEFVSQQITAIAEDIGTDAVKTGMLFNKSIIEVICGEIIKHQLTNVVSDPVMVSQTGHKLLEDDAIESMKTHLFPLADIITPNLQEASVLLNREIEGNEKSMREAAKALSAWGSKAVLLKGGHSNEKTAVDYLYIKDTEQTEKFETDRIATNNTHGTGCTLSSAIAAYLSRGYDMLNAVCEAKHYITEAIKAGAKYRTGKGSGPVHHFFPCW